MVQILFDVLNFLGSVWGAELIKNIQQRSIWQPLDPAQAITKLETRLEEASQKPPFTPLKALGSIPSEITTNYIACLGFEPGFGRLKPSLLSPLPRLTSTHG